MRRLADLKMGLTVCPLSNLRLCGVRDMKEHPLKKMLNHGLKATVNSDDPAYFGGYMNENFLAVAEALNLTRDDIVQLGRNAIEISFLAPEQKGQKAHELNDYIASAATVDPTFRRSRRKFLGGCRRGEPATVFAGPARFCG